MLSRISMTLICASMLTILGCDSGTNLPPPQQMPGTRSRAAATTTSLAPDQIPAILHCQTIIEWEGAQFVRFKEDNLDQCLDAVLELQVPFENGHVAFLTRAMILWNSGRWPDRRVLLWSPMQPVWRVASVEPKSYSSTP
jgi:hypothetical protein